MKKYQVIYADPPWRYANGTASPDDRVESRYQTMELEDICSLEVPSEDDAVLFLWATAPLLPEALKVLESWGFTYKSCAVWDKVLEGLGYWFRGQHELLLVGTKGQVSPPEQGLRISSLIRVKRGEHSSKPDQVRDAIVRMFPDKTRIELFAREWTSFWPIPEGWDVWGDQAGRQY